MNISRRHFFGASCVASSTIWGFGLLYTNMNAGSVGGRVECDGFGELVPDRERKLDLPSGFTYRVISTAGDKMTDGFIVPGLHDGMAALPGPQGTTVLVRNHEIDIDSPAPNIGAFGSGHALLKPIPKQLVYDRGHERFPALGAVTTLVYDSAANRVLVQHLSLAGTVLNCSGGPTPWGTWISCEETTQRAEHTFEKDHGYAFDVKPFGGITEPVPLRAMGRFRREAVAVDRRTGIVYQTEDAHDGLFYRFLPNAQGDLVRGGRLQALAIRDRASLNTSNWRMIHKLAANIRYKEPASLFSGALSTVPVGLPLTTRWVDLGDVDAPKNDLRLQGASKGAAQFCRGEGIWMDGERLYMACTSGGASERGQIWRYAPSPFEGTPAEERTPGHLELFVEPNERAVMNMPDNLTMSPWGDLFACEDGSSQSSLIAITPTGKFYHFACNRMNSAEFSGVAFSPDGSTLFVNIYKPGLTLAITGPWKRRSVAG